MKKNGVFFYKIRFYHKNIKIIDKITYIYHVIRKIIKLSLLLAFLFGGYCHATIANLYHRQQNQAQKQNDPRETISKPDNGGAIEDFLYHSSAAPLTTQTTYKQVHFYEADVIFQAHTTAAIHTISQHIANSTLGLAHFYKRILFPFHVFW